MSGQFCTLGSSSAADYCVRASGVLPMHCRIGCRQNGGFIECFDDNATITIAGGNKNRSRLTDGDILKIGVVAIQVKIPLPERPSASFNIAFNDHGNAEESDAPEVALTQPEVAVTQSQNQLETPTISPPVKPKENKTENLAPPIILPSDKTDLEPNEIEPDHSTKNQLESVTPTSSDPTPKEITSTDDSGRSSSTKTDKPIFEFDSVDSTDTKLTEEDLNVIENMNGNSLVLPDFDVMAAETFPDHNFDQSQPTDTPPDSSNSGSQNLIPGGSDTGKCCRWTGKEVLPTLELLEQHLSSLQCFDIETNVCLVPCSFGDIKQAVSDQSGPRMFLLTEKSQNDLIRFFAAKRWFERLGHPQALSMFLTLLPAKHIKLLFAEINTCVLVQQDSIELVRFNRELDL